MGTIRGHETGVMDRELRLLRILLPEDHPKREEGAGGFRVSRFPGAASFVATRETVCCRLSALVRL